MSEVQKCAGNVVNYAHDKSALRPDSNKVGRRRSEEALHVAPLKTDFEPELELPGGAGVGHRRCEGDAEAERGQHLAATAPPTGGFRSRRTETEPAGSQSDAWFKVLPGGQFDIVGVQMQILLLYAWDIDGGHPQRFANMPRTLDSFVISDSDRNPGIAPRDSTKNGARDWAR